MRVKIGLLKEKGGKKIAFHGFNAAYITRSGEGTDRRDVQLPQISNPECERSLHAKREKFLPISIFRSTQIRSSPRR